MVADCRDTETMDEMISKRLWRTAWAFVFVWLLVEFRSVRVAPRPERSDLVRLGLSGALLQGYSDENMWDLFLAPMAIRGRVVDQFGEPVGGADLEVVYSWFLGPVEGEVSQAIKAESTGEFEIEPREAEHVYISVSREGYQRVARVPGGARGSSMTVSQLDSESRGTDGRREVLLHLHRLDSSRSVVHHPTQVLTQAIGHEPIVLSVPGGDGATAGVDRIVVDFRMPDSADLERVRRPGPLDKPFDWSHRVTVPGGALAVVDDFVGLTAPEGGYIEMDHVEFGRNQRYWRPGLQRKYYVRFPSGRYGAVGVISDVFRGNGTARVEIWLNEEPGDRELSGGKVPLW